jgi:hypothetical protein
MDEIIEEPIAAPAPEPEDGGMYLTGMTIYDLNRAAKWAKFIAIFGFVCAGLLAIVALFISSIFSMIAAYSSTPIPAAMGGFLSVVYLIIAALIFVFNLFLYQFANRTITGLAIKHAETVERGIHRLQSYFKAMGIMLIIELGLFALCFVFGVIGTLLRH